MPEDPGLQGARELERLVEHRHSQELRSVERQVGRADDLERLVGDRLVEVVETSAASSRPDGARGRTGRARAHARAGFA